MAGLREVFGSGGARRARDIAYLLRRWKTTSSEHERRQAGLTLLGIAADVLVPGYIVTEDAKRWFGDETFLNNVRLAHQ